MPPARRRDVSEASVRLTKNNYNRPPLLSTFRGATECESCGESSDDPLSTEETQKQKRPEPATDDEPLSTTDEDSQLESPASVYSRQASKWSAGNLDAKLAQDDAKEEDDRKRTPDRTPTTKLRRTPKIAFKRESDGTPQTAVKRPKTRGGVKFKDDSDGKGELFGITTANQRRRKQSTYYRKLRFDNIHAARTKDIRPPFRSSDSDDHAVHSSAGTSNVPVFRELRAFPLDGFPSSSLPTDANNSTLFDHDASTSSFSSPPSSLFDPDEKPGPKFAEPEPPRCPMCDEIVDGEFVKTRPMKGLPVRKQMQFCRAHKTWTAKKEWTEKKYPTIDWDNLDGRIERHLSSLEDILMLRKPSVFRKQLEDSQDGKRANIRLTAGSKGLDMMSTGYYGPRGSKVMSDAIITRYASNIRELATTDPLLKAAGPSGYVQGVLVPELTVMLVKDDMGVDDGDAKKIMEDSMWIGDLLNEVPNDVVKVHRRRTPLAN